MAWGIPEQLDFTPKQVLKYQEGYVIVGVDGELQKISLDGKTLGAPVKPFPTPIRDAVIIENTLILTWLDQELLLARMAAIDLDNDFQTGVNRSELRVRRTIDNSIHPAGNRWSHVLDAEPISLTSNSDSFTFILWKKGVYNLSIDAHEIWRSAEPFWNKLKKLPRAMEAVATSCDEEVFEIWSKGGGLIRYNLSNGEIIEQKVLEIDGYLEKVFKCGKHYLLLLNNSTVALYEDDTIQLMAKLSGPITYAEWSDKDNGWHIAGWREIAFISTHSHHRNSLDEIAIFIDSSTGIYLFNDGTWDIVDSREEE